jgi:TRAP-type C4-dicarboxylate transport system substrate-binding protein
VTARLALATLLLSTVAHADQTVIRLGSVAPDGSGWARELRRFDQEIQQGTKGRVRIKLFMNGVAGDEIEMTERLKRRQLDAVGSAGMTCERFMPSLRVLRFPGLFQSRDEANFVMNLMRRELEADARRAGLVYLTGVGMGADLLFSKKPIRSLSELRTVRAWRWKPDEVELALNQEMGLQVEPGELDEASHWMEQKKVDAFWAIPSAALVFQWSLQAPYLLNLTNGHLFGCVLMAASVIDGLSPEDRRAVLAASAHLGEGVKVVVERIDEALLGGAFQHQGVKVIQPSEAFRAQFFASAFAARSRVSDRFAPRELLDRVLRMLADYRAEHPSK